MGGRARAASKAKSRVKNRAGEGTKSANIVEVTGVARTGAGPARGTAERLGDDLRLVRSEEFRDLCRTRPRDFTRRRKLPHDVLTESILAKRGRSLELDLRQLGKEGLLDEAGVSAQAFSRARQKLDPKALRMLVRHHSRGVYRDGGYLTWFGMVGVGIDGSSVDVDTNPETLDKWGNASNPGTRPQAQAGISTAYDVLNRQIVDVTVNRCAFNERAEVPGHVEACREAVGDAGLCLFLDRGYPSIALLARLAEGGTHFVVRCPRTFLADEFEACAAAGGDVTVEVELTRERLRPLVESGEEELLGRLLGLGSIRLRLVLVDIGAAQPERLVTDLGAERVTREDLKGGYHLRWGSETCYRFEKEQLELENVSGRGARIIEQDIYATAYLLNLSFDLANEADLEFERSGRQQGYRHRMAVNRTYAIGALRDELVGMVLIEDDGLRAEAMGRIVRELQRHLVPVRPGRSRPKDLVTRRKGKGKGKKRRYNNRYKRT